MEINDKRMFKRLDPVIHETAGTVEKNFYFRKDAVKSLTNFNKGTELHIITRTQLQRLRKHYRELYAITDCGHNLLLFKKHKKEMIPKVYDEYSDPECPSCFEELNCYYNENKGKFIGDNYCPECGQKLDWEETK